LGDLQPPSACLDDETDLRVDELLRDELEELTAFAAGLEREEGLDRSDVARIGSRAEELLTRSLKLGDTRAQAKVHVVLGKLRLFAEEYDASLRHLEAAYFVAELAGDVHTQHATCVTLVMLSARYLGDVKRAEYWASRLEMAAEQVGTDVARGEAALYRGTVHRVAGRVDDAVESLGRAVASLQPDSFSRAEALRTRGELGLMRGDLEGARADLSAAVTLLEGLSGAQHPDLAGPLNALATLEFTDGDFDAGLVLLERALSVTADRQNLQRALMQGNLALAYRERGRLAEALVVIEDVLSQLVASLGPHHPDTIRTEVERAELLLELEQEQEAVVVLERVFDSEAAPSDVRAQAATSLAPLSDEPRTILARAAGLPGLSPSWASYVAELLDAYDDGA
jgi:tetratricopeptide (TPR) repeat protein